MAKSDTNTNIGKMTKGELVDPGQAENFWLRSMKQTRYTMQISGPHHEKHKIRENFNHRKNDPPPRGTLGPKNANCSTIEFRAEPPMFFIYILVVYEE